MPEIYSLNEVLEIATGIERRGITFYDVMAKSTDNEETRRVFEELVEMERQHLQFFEGLGENIANMEPDGAGRTDNTDYITALVDEAVFTSDLITSEMASQADSDIRALELAVGAEKDSILFYYELKEMMPLKFEKMINRIIDEEKKHLLQLTTIKKTLPDS